MAREIPLTKGFVAVVDDEDYAEVSEWKWSVRHTAARTHFYAGRSTLLPDGRSATVRLHRVIMKTPPGMFVDHIDGDGLNCRRANMRNCTAAENSRNRRKSAVGRAPYKGIVQTKGGRWIAHLGASGVYYQSGAYDAPEDAAVAYDALARQHHGDFARLNFPERNEPAPVVPPRRRGKPKRSDGERARRTPPAPRPDRRIRIAAQALRAGLSLRQIARLMEVDEATVIALAEAA